MSTRTGVCAFLLMAIPLLAGCAGSQVQGEELIAYESQGALHLMRPDGSDMRLLLPADHPELDGGGESPAWAPDGRRLAFSASAVGGSSDIWVVDADGTGLGNLTQDLTLADDAFSPDEFAPAWSPDGRQIAFSGGCVRGLCIVVMDEDGGGVRRLTLGPDDGAPSWSPDGKRIAFTRAGDIHVVDADGSEARRLTRTDRDCPAKNSFPAWSPDGTRIAYVHGVPTADHETACGGITDWDGDWVYEGELRVMTADGAPGRRIFPAAPLFPTRKPSVAGRATWSPDGDRLVFEGYGAQCTGLYVVETKSRASSRLTRCPDDGDPAWGPGARR
jgi:Tol biopolymer transport system component